MSSVLLPRDQKESITYILVFTSPRKLYTYSQYICPPNGLICGLIIHYLFVPINADAANKQMKKRKFNQHTNYRKAHSRAKENNITMRAKYCKRVSAKSSA